MRAIASKLLTKAGRDRALKSAFKATHIGYFGAVFLEGHGAYAALGLAMLVFVVADIFLHFAGE